MTEPRPATLSAAVMAHPRRADLVEDLLRRLDRPVPVVWDKINDRHETGLRALQAFDPAATHHLVIQDDALPCRDLLASIERALAYVPDGHPASFYLGRVKPFRQEINRLLAHSEGASWLRFDGPYWGPAVVVPTANLPALTEWWTTRKAQVIQNYDRRISWWHRRHGFSCWYSWPSLVDHRGDDSLVAGHTAARHAHKALGPHRSGLTVDWSGPVLDVPNSSRLDRARQQRARLDRARAQGVA